MTNILFITLSNLGDIILTTPVLEKLSEHFPDAGIDVITGAPGKDIFRKHPAVRHVKVREKRASLSARAKEIMEFRGEHYDVVVDLKNSLIPFVVGAKKRSSFTPYRKGPVLHKRNEHLSKLRGLGIKDPLANTHFFVPVSAEDKKYVDKVLGDEWTRMVVVNPGAKSHLKRWDADKFTKLVDLLVSDLKCRVVLTGAEEDTDITGRIASNVTTPVKDLCSKTTIGALAELMSRADLVITNDSAPLHIASAVNTPTLGIFGPTDEKKYGPLSKKNKVVKPPATCRPCEKALCPKGKNQGCISDISVDEVFDAARKMLGGNI